MAKTAKPKTPFSEHQLPCGRPRSMARPIPSSVQLDAWKRQLKDFLTREGLKFTEQRWKIAALILSSEGHLDAQNLVEQVRKKHQGIGAATVYRSIKVLCSAGILKESLTDADGKVFYELDAEGHHDHIVCVNCGEIFEFFDPKIESLQKTVTQDLGFEEIRHRHVIYAECNYRS